MQAYAKLNTGHRICWKSDCAFNPSTIQMWCFDEFNSLSFSCLHFFSSFACLYSLPFVYIFKAVKLVYKVFYHVLSFQKSVNRLGIDELK